MEPVSSSVVVDPDARRYQEHWQPVLDAAARQLLQRVDAATRPLPHAISVVLDVGAGTGALTIPAARCWPGARVLGLDATAGMLSMARERASRLDRSGPTARLEWLVADAVSMPLEDASVDVAISSFVLQLVGDREAVLREIHRVLRPGGTLGFVTWMAEDVQMPADIEFDEAVYELELDEPDPAFRESKPGDYQSIDEARTELLRAGFRGADIDVRPERLSYSWSREGYLGFKRGFDERELFDTLDSRDRSRLVERLLERWAALPDSAFTLQAPLVSAVARRT